MRIDTSRSSDLQVAIICQPKSQSQPESKFSVRGILRERAHLLINSSMDKKSLSESDICAKYITPAVVRAGWDEATQLRREVYFTNGRIIVRGKLVTRGKAKRADYVLYYQHFALAIVEAKDNKHTVGDGMQQALDYATTLDIPFVFSSNGDGFVFHDRTGTSI